MANAQKMIEERKKALNALKAPDPSPAPTSKSDANTAPTSKISKGVSPSVQGTEEKAKKIAQLQVMLMFSRKFTFFFLFLSKIK